MIISGLQIRDFNNKVLIGELKNAGEPNSREMIKAAWEVSKACKDKMSALNAPFDFFLKECVKSDLARKGGNDESNA